MQNFLLSLVMTFSILSFDISAEESKEDGTSNLFNQIVIIEGIIAANSGLAAHHPEGWGWAMTALSPLCAAVEGAEWQQLAGLSTCIGMGQYNALELSKDKYNTTDIFKHNFVLMHGLLATAVIGDHLLNYFNAPQALAFKSTKDAGLALTFNQVF